ncbi:hypothetical protein NIES4103_09360 [Nostoc sp. NIES-4103]|nr:hypothetical protein NIES4103_09360 [Nostoc sp. NIES-4103]
MNTVLTSPPAPLLQGEGSKTLIFSFLLPRLLGEGGREGEVIELTFFQLDSCHHAAQAEVD